MKDDVSRETNHPERFPVPRETPAVPEVAVTLFGAAWLPVVEKFAHALVTVGTERGLLGPREASRIWERHLLNCAVIADLIPTKSTVADIGSGAGLPGLVVAIRRPDLRLTLVEPLLRRSVFLTETVAELGLENVRVVRARAEELHGSEVFDVVTSRAVAPLTKLARWSLPLVDAGGCMLAMKGGSADAELADARDELRRLGVLNVSVETIGAGILDPAVTVVRILRE